MLQFLDEQDSGIDTELVNTMLELPLRTWLKPPTGPWRTPIMATTAGQAG